MNAKQLATRILQYRGSASLVMPGTLQDEIGSEAMREALDRRWLEADVETGFLRLPSHQSKFTEMITLAEAACDICKKHPCECCETCGHCPCTCPKTESTSTRSMLLGHAQRHLCEYAVPPGYASGQAERTQGPAVKPDTQSNLTSEWAVGEDVAITDEGKVYQGKVASKNPDGTFKLSFGPSRPVKDRPYRKEEIQRIAPGRVQLPT